MSGICYLVGAGPGDPGLITLNGMCCLQQADIVFHDHLASSDLLLSAEKAELVSVGKRAGDHTLPQEEIGRRLCDEVRAGKTVVRLKGGDPFVFGRGGEEMLALAEAGLPFIVVPGVTAACGAAAYARLPLTHRGLANRVTFVTGTPGTEQAEPDWQALAATGGTLCIYMGRSRLDEIARKLTEAGLDPATPAAIVENATLPEQRTLVTTLRDLPQRAEAERIGTPAIVIIGAVAELGRMLPTFHSPLAGKRVLLTRCPDDNESFARALRVHQAIPLELPCIRIEPAPHEMSESREVGESESRGGLDHENSEPTATDPLSSALLAMRAGSFDWVVLTSPHGVQQIWQRLRLLGLDARTFGQARIAVVGPATALALEACGLVADLVPEKHRSAALAEALLEQLRETPRQLILLLRSDLATSDLPQRLQEAGHAVTDIASHRTVPCSEPAPENLLAHPPEIIVLHSPGALSGLHQRCGERFLDFVKHARIVTVGPTTSAAVRKAGLSVHREAASPRMGDLIAALEN